MEMKKSSNNNNTNHNKDDSSDDDEYDDNERKRYEKWCGRNGREKKKSQTNLLKLFHITSAICFSIPPFDYDQNQFMRNLRNFRMNYTAVKGL